MIGTVCRISGLTLRVAHHGFDRQLILLRKLPVPLIVSRYRHDGTGTVVHQHIVGDPDGYGLSRQRMRCAQPVSMPNFSAWAISASATDAC
ncbi:MAG: hypothetical protein CM15mP74_34430 [Halieaceae bacterium]|nr:MAG: hypothetical protein CM15mP74_34430 [Halieaceae bacterium]